MAVLSLFMPEQQPFLPALPHFAPQQADAVVSLVQLSLLHPSLQHDAAALSLPLFIQDMESLPPSAFMS